MINTVMNLTYEETRRYQNVHHRLPFIVIYVRDNYFGWVQHDLDEKAYFMTGALGYAYRHDFDDNPGIISALIADDKYVTHTAKALLRILAEAPDAVKVIVTADNVDVDADGWPTGNTDQDRLKKEAASVTLALCRYLNLPAVETVVEPDAAHAEAILTELNANAAEEASRVKPVYFKSHTARDFDTVQSGYIGRDYGDTVNVRWNQWVEGSDSWSGFKWTFNEDVPASLVFDSYEEANCRSWAPGDWCAFVEETTGKYHADGVVVNFEDAADYTKAVLTVKDADSDKVFTIPAAFASTGIYGFVDNGKGRWDRGFSHADIADQLIRTARHYYESLISDRAAAREFAKTHDIDCAYDYKDYHGYNYAIKFNWMPGGWNDNILRIAAYKAYAGSKNDLPEHVEKVVEKPAEKPAEKTAAPAGRPATPKQVNCLSRFGFDAKNWTLKQASAVIGAISENGWRLPARINPKTYAPA